MMSKEQLKKLLKEEILTYDIVHSVDEDGKLYECVEVIMADRVIDVFMNTKEVNIGLIINKIIEDDLYEA